jgi:hypothetical protein
LNFGCIQKCRPEGRPDKQSNKRKVPGALPVCPPPCLGSLAASPRSHIAMSTRNLAPRRAFIGRRPPSARNSDARIPCLRLRDRAYSSHAQCV